MIRVRRVMPAVVAEIIRKAPMSPEKVRFAWRSAVGPVLQRVTEAQLDEQGVLHVKTADTHWAREVRRSSKLIRARLEVMLGAGVIKRIVTIT